MIGYNTKLIKWVHVFYLLPKMVSGCRTFENPCDTKHTCMNSNFVNILMLVKHLFRESFTSKIKLLAIL